MPLSVKKDTYTITDGKHTSLTLDAFGITPEQIEIIERRLGVVIQQKPGAPQTYVVELSTNNTNRPRGKNVLATAIQAVQQTMMHNRPDSETSEKFIRNYLRAQGYTNSLTSQTASVEKTGRNQVTTSKAKAAPQGKAMETEIITEVDNIDLSALGQAFSLRPAALRVFHQEESIGFPVRYEKGDDERFHFIAEIPAGTENVEEKLNTLKAVLTHFHYHFTPRGEIDKNAPPLNLDKVRKSLHALQKQIIKNDTEHGLEPSGITPEFTQKAITVAAPYNKRLESLRAKMQQMTKFLPNGQLLFDQATSETWELTPGQDAFVKAFPHKAALIVKGPAGSGKTEFTVRMVLEMFANGEIDQMIISTPVDEGGEEIGFRKGDDREKMGPHINQILEAMDGHLGCGDFKKGKEIREELITAGVIEITSLGVISGRNLRRKALIVDEAHKAKMPHLLLCMSRIHTNGSKVVLMGDERQHISAGVSDFRDFTKIFADPAYAPYIAQITFSADDIRRHPMIKLMSERGDDIPPGLKKKMKEEQMTFEKKAALLKAHFEKSAKPGPKNILSDKLAQEIIRRFTPEEVFQMLEEQLHGAPGNDM